MSEDAEAGSAGRGRPQGTAIAPPAPVLGQGEAEAKSADQSGGHGASGRSGDFVLRAAGTRTRREPTLSGSEIVAGVLSLLWIAVITLIMVFSRTDGAAAGGFDPVRFLMTLMAVFLPVAVIWVGTTSAKSARIMREESQRLQAAIDAIRHSYLSQSQVGRAGRPMLERKLDEIAKAQRKTEAAIATFASVRVPLRGAPEPSATDPDSHRALPGPATGSGEQPSLALGAVAQSGPPLPTETLLTALNFPESPEDAEGFRALRRALQDRSSAQLIQASQDVLTLLSQDGIYMDDLSPDRAKPDVWRRFAQGERGRAVAALGGIRDRSSLALAAARMRTDTIFRDAVHHFLRRFDQTLQGFEKTASDAEISALADTRTSRAFMLLGRVTGIFD